MENSPTYCSRVTIRLRTIYGKASVQAATQLLPLLLTASTSASISLRLAVKSCNGASSQPFSSFKT
eukprot:scaffold42736_cov153-Skeletonema_marinoi.AAC.1